MWVAYNLIQAAYTELCNDEAYYFIYAQHLDFGYFDHPPMIAFLIKIGTWLLPGELGVRWPIVLLGGATFLLMDRLTNGRNTLLLFTLFCSVSVFQFYGFIAVPDAPLLFFVALFFLAYRQFLRKEDWRSVLCLTLAVTAMIYTKYHSFLILIFTMISNPFLLSKRRFYFVVFGSFMLYFPHVLWQYGNDFPSYWYHVANKSQEYYNPLHSLEYLGGQWLICGPLVGWWLYKRALRFTWADGLKRALWVNLVGFFAFFLFSTFNAAVEPNWTSPAMVALVVLAVLNTGDDHFSNRTAFYLSGCSILLFALVRLHFISGFIPERAVPKSEFHGWEKWSREMAVHANGRPVVFMNSYQKAAKYTFYTGQPALSMNNIRYRRNQYDLWPVEDSLQGKSVLLILNWYEPQADTLFTSKGRFSFEEVDNFRSYGKIRIKVEPATRKFRPSERVSYRLTFDNGYSHPVDFGSNTAYPVWLTYAIYKFEGCINEQGLLQMKDRLVDTRTLDVEVKMPKEPGVYYLRFALRNGWFPASMNGDLIQFEVEDNDQ